MQKKRKSLVISLVLLLALSSISLITTTPVFAQNFKVYKGSNDFIWKKPDIDISKKT
ncbi:MAG: hypothetical protein JO072_08185, partial [Parafilimonas sp.]|nr:hypothetical protein [Parafilimonas sp.]